MTLPASFPISISQIASEVALPVPLSINHPRILALANKSGFPISFGDLLGKTGRIDGNFSANSSSVILFGNPAFFGTSLFSGTVSGGGLTLVFNATPSWTGNILFKNNTTGISSVMNNAGGPTPNQWLGSAPANLVRANTTDNFSITPSN